MKWILPFFYCTLITGCGLFEDKAERAPSTSGPAMGTVEDCNDPEKARSIRACQDRQGNDTLPPVLIPSQKKLEIFSGSSSLLEIKVKPTEKMEIKEIRLAIVPSTREVIEPIQYAEVLFNETSLFCVFVPPHTPPGEYTIQLTAITSNKEELRAGSQIAFVNLHVLQGSTVRPELQTIEKNCPKTSIESKILN